MKEPTQSTLGSGASGAGTKRFAAYLRTSNEDLQSPEDSKRWQLSRCEALIAGHGRIVCTFHDVGQSRTLPWKRRQQATALLAEIARKDRRFDAIVVAEPQRAFAGSEFANVFPILTHHKVELWVPELGGAIDPDSEAHDLAMMLFGGMSKGERNRIRIRVKAAMRSQVASGRWPGGRAPYGYVAVDAGPHTHPAKAKEGKRLKRLEVDPVAAPVVQRVFADYLTGTGIRAIAESLTADGILSPSAHNPEHNTHRAASCGSWSIGALQAMLRNPVYTGRIVFGRRVREEVLVDPTDPSEGYNFRVRWVDPEHWVWSAEQTHPAIISLSDYEAVQRALAARAHGKGPRAPKRKQKPRPLRGLVVCGLCQRRMESTKVEGYRYLRCRLVGSQYAPNEALQRTHPKSTYLREDRILPAVLDWLAGIFDPTRADETAKALVSAAAEAVSDPDRDALADHWNARYLEAEAKLRRYKALVDGGSTSLELLAGWIAEAERERAMAADEVARLAPVETEAPSVEEIKALIVRLAKTVARLSQADSAVLNDTFRKLGLTIEWMPKADTARIFLAPQVSHKGRDGGVRQSLPLAALIRAEISLRAA